MSNVCCKEFTGWFKSFTKTERALAVLEAVLLVVLVVLLTLLILHLIVCSKVNYRADSAPNKTTPNTVCSYYDPVHELGPYVTNTESTLSEEQRSELTETPDIKCSWTPFAKTTTIAHYYDDSVSENSEMSTMLPEYNENATSTFLIHMTTSNATAEVVSLEPHPTITQATDVEELIQSGHSDGEEAEDKYKSYVVALVKLKPPNDVLFGCILTIVSEYWTLTAASCIEAIEEIDSLDSFIIMDQYGTNRKGPLQTIEDVQIHPLYEGRNTSHDLAALKSAGKLGGTPVGLASFLDYALVNLGDKFTILGYGAFRSIDKSPSGRSLRRVPVYAVSEEQCAAGAPALRHLWAGRSAARAACADAPLCAGQLRARTLPCNYCAGTPLLLGAALLGLMADNPQCGVACEPSLYVNVPLHADWIRATVAGRDIE